MTIREITDMLDERSEAERKRAVKSVARWLYGIHGAAAEDWEIVEKRCDEVAEEIVGHNERLLEIASRRATWADESADIRAIPLDAGLPKEDE